MAAINKKEDEQLSKPMNHRVSKDAIRDFNLAYNSIEKIAIQKNINISKGSFLDALIKKCVKQVTITDIK